MFSVYELGNQAAKLGDGRFVRGSAACTRLFSGARCHHLSQFGGPHRDCYSAPPKPHQSMHAKESSGVVDI